MRKPVKETGENTDKKERSSEDDGNDGTKGIAMGQVVNLARYRYAKKRSYMKKYDTHLNKFVGNFIYSNVRASFDSVSRYYMANKQREQAEAWDYYDFRETLKDAVDEVFGGELWAECRSLYWFDARYICRDDLIDRVVSQLVLGPDMSAQK